MSNLLDQDQTRRIIAIIFASNRNVSAALEALGVEEDRLKGLSGLDFQRAAVRYVLASEYNLLRSLRASSLVGLSVDDDRFMDNLTDDVRTIGGLELTAYAELMRLANNDHDTVWALAQQLKSLGLHPAFYHDAHEVAKVAVTSTDDM
jgi:hypothetical protein